MFVWLLFFALVAIEVSFLVYKLRRELIPIVFNQWAPAIYAFVLAGDFTLFWLVAGQIALESEGTFALLAGVTVFILVVITLMTLFLRWVVRLDLLDPPHK